MSLPSLTIALYLQKKKEEMPEIEISQRFRWFIQVACFFFTNNLKPQRYPVYIIYYDKDEQQILTFKQLPFNFV